jgi:hypothetical protein
MQHENCTRPLGLSHGRGKIESIRLDNKIIAHKEKLPIPCDKKPFLLNAFHGKIVSQTGKE